MPQLLNTFSMFYCASCLKLERVHDQTGLCQPCYEEIIGGE